jgi:hypothetical protein
MSNAGRFRLNTPNVVAEAIEAAEAADDEAIVVNLKTGTYYSIRGDSILLWKALIGGISMDEITKSVVQATGARPDVAEAAVTGFRKSLEDEELIVEGIGEYEQTEPVNLAAGGAGLLEPTFERFSDMQDLILMDPVHEVDERGWPHIRETA